MRPKDPRDVDPDKTSDPANDEREGHDWSAEGGATTEGPATAVSEERVNEPEDDGSQDGSG